MKILLASLIALTPVSALAGEYQEGYSASRTCFKTEYREEYVPGDLDNPGYVKSWNETLEFPCNGDTAEGRVYKRHVTVYENVDTNDCSDGTAAGAILGGGLGAVLSRGDGRWWAIPTGVVTGAMLGCQIDGG